MCRRVGLTDEGMAEGKPEGGKVPVAKAVFGEQAAIVVNDVTAMRTAKRYAKSKRPTLIGSGGHRSGGVMVNKSEHEKRTILWSDPFNDPFKTYP